ncbi:cupin domain-containing protein [Paludibacterium paludis]|uniref:Cupin type-2 domain-containing protein n=1 Tax=Paludibacterium paludis TaxID=1225769 RepID=A0A918U8U1_9NEIS|nr:cupin domain-containing protein [Paludibacterium paludis]GGY10565.1 hypothetical protein GCM10011289_11660 [Paludibacterium paludis]
MEIINWDTTLHSGVCDTIAGITIVKLLGDESFGTYITRIAPGHRVNPHYHHQGEEHYHILSGEGEIHLAGMTDGTRQSCRVGARCSFSIPPMVEHSLINNGEEPLVLMFSCPASHLGSDRFTR